MATTKRTNHLWPSAVSHNQDSGWLLRRFIACWRPCTLLLESLVRTTMRRMLCCPWSQRHLPVRRLVSQNSMSVCALEGDWARGGIWFLRIMTGLHVMPCVYQKWRMIGYTYFDKGNKLCGHHDFKSFDPPISTETSKQ